jgi:hypothetical protein
VDNKLGSMLRERTVIKLRYDATISLEGLTKHEEAQNNQFLGLDF